MLDNVLENRNCKYFYLFIYFYKKLFKWYKIDMVLPKVVTENIAAQQIMMMLLFQFL